MQEMWVRSLGQEDSLEKELTTHSSILAWEIPWTEEPGKLQFMGLQRSQTWPSNLARMHTHTLAYLYTYIFTCQSCGFPS